MKTYYVSAFQSEKTTSGEISSDSLPLILNLAEMDPDVKIFVWDADANPSDCPILVRGSRWHTKDLLSKVVSLAPCDMLFLLRVHSERVSIPGMTFSIDSARYFAQDTGNDDRPYSEKTAALEHKIGIEKRIDEVVRKAYQLQGEKKEFTKPQLQSYAETVWLVEAMVDPEDVSHGIVTAGMEDMSIESLIESAADLVLQYASEIERE